MICCFSSQSNMVCIWWWEWQCSYQNGERPPPKGMLQPRCSGCASWAMLIGDEGSFLLSAASTGHCVWFHCSCQKKTSHLWNVSARLLLKWGVPAGEFAVEKPLCVVAKLYCNLCKACLLPALLCIFVCCWDLHTPRDVKSALGLILLMWIKENRVCCP